MATYKEVKGVTIQTLSEDPVLAGAAGGSWSSGGDLNNGIVGNCGFGAYQLQRCALNKGWRQSLVSG